VPDYGAYLQVRYRELQHLRRSNLMAALEHRHQGEIYFMRRYRLRARWFKRKMENMRRVFEAEYPQAFQ
jgi:hypothetical protein